MTIMYFGTFINTTFAVSLLSSSISLYPPPALIPPTEEDDNRMVANGADKTTHTQRASWRRLGGQPRTLLSFKETTRVAKDVVTEEESTMGGEFYGFLSRSGCLPPPPPYSLVNPHSMDLTPSPPATSANKRDAWGI